jgi:serine phosphatase RsbU (regulator of sigma subunit)/predicted CoA-binding protein
MPIQATEKEIQNWISSIYFPDSSLVQDISSNWPEYRKIFIDKIAEYVYKDIQRTQHLYSSPFTFNKEFGRLSDEEKLPWYNFASDIPAKLKSLNLCIRPYKDFCRTCLILYKDLENLARADYDSYCLKQKSDNQAPVPFNDLPEKKRRFYIEMNHLIPLDLKRIGYELVRPQEISEISENMVRKFARAIHSRYQHEIIRQDSGSKKSFYMSWIHTAGDAKNQYTGSFEDLPEDIRSSNLDNAYHIPTKLLAIGYKIRPVRKGFESSALHLSEEEVETMARVEHIRWCWDKILNGWFYGDVRDSRKKTHPSIIPYEDLDESEKEKDRELVRLIPALLKDIDYEAFPVNPDKISNLPYAIKPHSSIHKILDETRQMNTQIRKLVTLSPEVDGMVMARNIKIEEAIKEIESSYNYAQHIQETFLPDNLYVRECFPESFVLFKPKDIVSGDFYFFNKKGNLISFAAVDCTGHGIPGALLSIIGYGILDQAINELKLNDPPEILNHLYSKVHRFLRWDQNETGLADDMDIALCTLDLKTGILNYAGVGSPLYHITEKGLIEYKPQNSNEECGENDNCPFVSERIRMEQGDTIYLFSDGYVDQFGGRFHKKYQSGRFKDLLLGIQSQSMPEQGDRLYEEIEKWREENNEDQTDDILVIGIRI